MENIVRSTETNGRSPERFAEQAKAGQAFYENWRARAEKLARISALALALGPVPDSAEASDLSIVESNHSSLVLSNGENVVLPSFRGMEAPKLHIPKEGLADQLIVLFPQTHRLIESQMHGMPAYRRWDVLHEALDSQTLIYGALKDAVQRDSLGLSKVCTEGETDENYVNFLKITTDTALHAVPNLLAPYLEGYRISQIAGELDDYDASSTEYRTLFDKYERTIRAYTDRYKLVFGADLVASGDGYIKLCAAEEKYAYLRPLEIAVESHKDGDVTSEENSNYFQALLDGREDGVLRTIAHHSDSVIGLTFGADHDFLDNISEWNEANPNHQYAIV